MSFRDDIDALVARRDALREKRARQPDDPQWQAEWAQLRAEIDDTRTALAQTLVDRTRVAKRCDADWTTMAGGEHVRECTHCDKHVYQLSGLTAVEAAELLTGADGELCLRLYRRRDGTVMTSDCREGSRRRWRRSLRVIGVVAGLAAGAAASVSVPAEFHAEVRSLRRARQTRHVVMGGAPDFEGDEELESDYSAADAKTDLQKLQWMLLE